MRGGSIQFIVSIVLFLLVVDAYAFRGIRILTQELPYLWRFLVHGLYWMVPLLILTLMVWISLNFRITSYNVCYTKLLRLFRSSCTLLPLLCEASFRLSCMLRISLTIWQCMLLPGFRIVSIIQKYNRLTIARYSLFFPSIL